MKKLFTILTTSFLVGACASTKTATSSTSAPSRKASDKFMTFGKETLFAYATDYPSLEEESPETNLVAKELYNSALKYNYTFIGWPEDTQGKEASTALTPELPSNYYNLKWTTGENAKNASEVAAAILKKWQTANVEIGFIQTNPETKDAIANGKPLQDAIANKVYTGKLVLTGTNTSHTDLYAGDKGGVWSAYNNVATFEFSEITTAYNTGYLTQSQFGKVLLSDGTSEIRTVGYIVAALEKDDKKWNVLQMKKANAFRQGVIDAQKEQSTGTARFVSKSEASDKSREKTLMFESTDINKYFDKLKTSTSYTDNDHSFVYYAGADGEINRMVVNELINSPVSNSNGHKLIVDIGGVNTNDEATGFGVVTSTDTSGGTWSAGTIGSNGSVTARVFMANKSWVRSEDNNVSTTWSDAEKSANALAIEAVLAATYGENIGKINYFGKHTYIGTFPEFSKVDTRDVPADAHKIDKNLLTKIRKDLFVKNIDIATISDEFLGSGL